MTNSEFVIITPDDAPMGFPEGTTYGELLDILKAHSENASGEWKLNRNLAGGLVVDLAHAEDGQVVEH